MQSTTTEISLENNFLTLCRTLEVEIESTEMRILRLRAVSSQARRDLVTALPGSADYDRCRRLIDSSAARVADLSEYAADCRRRLTRLRKRQTADLSTAATIAGALIGLLMVFLGI